jgi:peptidoglycan/LPS O-acetylase OafA/YrhL
MPVTQTHERTDAAESLAGAGARGPEPRPRLPALTTIRFFAALQVVLFHMRVTGMLAGGPWWYQNFASIGYVGVNCFFVLSGFILVYTYAGAIPKARRFWQARFARIYPAYAFSLAVSAPFFFYAVRHLDLPMFVWSKEHLIAASILTVSLLQSWIPQAALTWNSVCWSLSVEAFFYLMFPLLLVWTKGLTSRRLLAGVVVWSVVSLTFSVWYIVVHPDGIDKISSPEITLFWKNLLSFNPLVRIPEFLVGLFAGRLFLLRKTDAKFATPLTLCGAVIVATLTALVGKIPNALISAGFLSPAFAAIIYGLALQPRWSWFLGSRWLVLLGEASYSLYLLHSLVISRVFDALAFLPHWMRVAAALGASIGAALVIYLVIEGPARRALRPRRGPGQ